MKTTKPAALTAERQVNLSVTPQAPTTVSPFPMFTFGDGPATPKKTKTGTVYPQFTGEEIEVPVCDPSSGEVIRTEKVKEASYIGARLKRDMEVFKNLESGIKSDKLDLVNLCIPFYFKVNHGVADVPSSVAVPTVEGEVLVTFPDKYAGGEPSKVIPIIGAEAMAQHFQQSFEIKVDGDLLPQTPATQKLLNDMHNLFKDAGHSEAVEFKTVVKPKKGFKNIRHTVFDVDQNIQLNKVCKIVAMVKTEARGGKDDE